MPKCWSGLKIILLSVLLLPVPVLAEKLLVPDYRADKDVTNRNFEGANLEQADFSGSNASGSSFINASLDRANLSLANFQNTNLTNVTFKLALIEFTDFTGAEGITAGQLAEACLPRVDEEDNLWAEEFDVEAYELPEGCEFWEEVPRG